MGATVSGRKGAAWEGRGSGVVGGPDQLTPAFCLAASVDEELAVAPAADRWGRFVRGNEPL